MFIASMGKELEAGEVFGAKWGFTLPLIRRSVKTIQLAQRDGNKFYELHHAGDTR